MNISVSSMPIGSVAISAVPMRLQTCSTSSGNAASTAFSICVLYLIESSRSVPVSRTTLTAIAPSDSRGTNSEPKFGAMMPNATNANVAAKPMTIALCRMATCSAGM